MTAAASTPRETMRGVGRFDIQRHRICFQTPRRLTDIDSWHEHIPFAYFCIELLEPRVLVELGAFKGDSYCAFNQAMEELGLPGKAYAVDTWAGDEHTGSFGQEVYDDLKAHHDPLYAGRSRLIRATFDETLQHFSDGSVDLLHIDGLHTYEAVRHDFETWLPKMSERGVVLFHDVNVHERDFGVWQLWDEISPRWPGFCFAHGNGLGVLAVGSAVPTAFREFIAQANDPEQRVHEIFHTLGNRLALMGRMARADYELGIYRHDIPIARDRIAEQDQELDRLRRALGSAEHHVEQLETFASEQSDERRRLKHELDAVLASTSWQVTQPLRLAIRIARALLGRVRRLVARPFRGEAVTLRGLGGVAWENGHYRAESEAVTFDMVPAGLSIPTGWCAVSFTGASNLGPLGLTLLARQENEMGVVTAYDLPSADRRRVSALLNVPATTAQLGLQVRGSPDTFSIDGLEMRRLGRGEAALRLIVRKLKTLLRHPGQLARLPVVLFRTLRQEGVRGLRSWLAGGGSIVLPRSHVISRDSEPEIGVLDYQPLVSFIMPVYEIDPELLTKAVESVQAQLYENWELCVSDDGSQRLDTRQCLDRLAAADRRIKLVRAEANGGISAASNKALAMAEGEFVAFLDHDDMLEPAALQHYVKRLNDKPDTDIIYGDEDKIDPKGRRSDPFYKPDWSPILFCGVMYVGHLLMVRRALVEAVGGFDSTYDGIQDFELMLRLSERTERIEHVRRILYHWRRIPGSLADSTEAKSDITPKQAKAVTAHLGRLGIRATAEPHPKLPHRVQLKPEPRTDWPLVSIVIPSKDAPELIGRCLDTIFGKTLYRNFEVIVVDNGTTDSKALASLQKHPVKIVRFDERFNFSRANNLGAAAASGDYLLLLNNDTEITDGGWLDKLVACMELPKVGAVGPLLLYPDCTVQHAGVALGLRGTADHVMRGFPADSDGYAGSLACTREVAAVTAACLMVRREVYEQLGGMRENYGTHYQDADFCLRLRNAGYTILYTPATSLIHHESATRGDHYDQLDRALFKDGWDPLILAGDPYHNANVPAYSQPNR